eukprot:c15641_g1_i1 orf=3-185(-)
MAKLSNSLRPHALTFPSISMRCIRSPATLALRGCQTSSETSAPSWVVENICSSFRQRRWDS